MRLVMVLPAGARPAAAWPTASSAVRPAVASARNFVTAFIGCSLVVVGKVRRAAAPVPDVCLGDPRSPRSLALPPFLPLPARRAPPFCCPIAVARPSRPGGRDATRGLALRNPTGVINHAALGASAVDDGHVLAARGRRLLHRVRHRLPLAALHRLAGRPALASERAAAGAARREPVRRGLAHAVEPLARAVRG